MRADELAAPAGDTFKFTEIGDTLEGVVTYVGDWQTQTNKFNDREEEVARIGIDVNGNLEYVWPRKGSAMASAIAQALRDAQQVELTEGQTLKLMYASDKDTGKGNPMKMFKAKITPGEPRGAGSGNGGVPADEEPFIRDATVTDI